MNHPNRTRVSPHPQLRVDFATLRISRRDRRLDAALQPRISGCIGAIDESTRMGATAREPSFALDRRFRRTRRRLFSR